MAGPRYLDWTHVHVHGDRAAAAPLVPFGRKLLGYLAAQRARGGQEAVIQRTLPDGSIVRAEFIGSIPRITIVPTGGGGQTIRTRTRIVVCGPEATSTVGRVQVVDLADYAVIGGAFVLQREILEQITDSAYGGAFNDGIAVATFADGRYLLPRPDQKPTRAVYAVDGTGNNRLFRLAPDGEVDLEVAYPISSGAEDPTVGIVDVVGNPQRGCLYVYFSFWERLAEVDPETLDVLRWVSGALNGDDFLGAANVVVAPRGTHLYFTTSAFAFGDGGANSAHYDYHAAVVVDANTLVVQDALDTTSPYPPAGAAPIAVVSADGQWLITAATVLLDDHGDGRGFDDDYGLQLIRWRITVAEDGTIGHTQVAVAMTTEMVGAQYIAVSPDLKHVVLSGQQVRFQTDDDLAFFDFETLAFQGLYAAEARNYYGLSFSPDSKWLHTVNVPSANTQPDLFTAIDVFDPVTRTRLHHLELTTHTDRGSAALAALPLPALQE